MFSMFSIYFLVSVYITRDQDCIFWRLGFDRNRGLFGLLLSCCFICFILSFIFICSSLPVFSLTHFIFNTPCCLQVRRRRCRQCALDKDKGRAGRDVVCRKPQAKKRGWGGRQRLLQCKADRAQRISIQYLAYIFKDSGCIIVPRISWCCLNTHA